MTSCESCETGAIVDYDGKELKEEDVKACVKQLREMLNADDKFQSFRKDDSYLLRFLHCTDFDVEQAFKRISGYHSLLLEHPEWFGTDSPIKDGALVEQNTRIILPNVRDKCGRRIYVSKADVMDPTKMSPQQCAHLDEYWFELVLDEPETQSSGIAIIMDMHGLRWNLFQWLTPSVMKVSSRKVDLYPIKKLVFHVVNTSMLVNVGVRLMWPFLSSKIKEQFHFHFNNWESLHEHVSPDILPPEYGGTGPALDFDAANRWLYDNNSRIAENLKHHHVKKV